MKIRWNNSVFHGCNTIYIVIGWQLSIKTVVKHDHQNQAINIEIANNQYIYSGTRSTRGEREIFQRVQIKSIDRKILSCVDWANNPETKKI